MSAYGLCGFHFIRGTVPIRQIERVNYRASPKSGDLFAKMAKGVGEPVMGAQRDQAVAIGERRVGIWREEKLPIRPPQADDDQAFAP